MWGFCPEYLLGLFLGMAQYNLHSVTRADGGPSRWEFPVLRQRQMISIYPIVLLLRDDGCYFHSLGKSKHLVKVTLKEKESVIL